MSAVDRKSTILIVDDNPIIFNMLERYLNRDEYTILTTDNGFEALRLAKEHRPDLLLLDIMMPGLTGLQVCEELMADPYTADIHVIFISAKGETDDRVRGLELGAVDYITKPFELNEVKARVELHLRLKKTQQILENKSRELEALTAGFGLARSDPEIEPLLRIWDREALEERLSEEFRKASDKCYHVCLLLVEIDHFKEYNERYGRKAGDQVLRTVVGALKSNMRRQDFLFRHAGMEFVVMLPRTSLGSAGSRAERLREAVRQERIQHDHAEGLEVVTVSMGGAWSYPPSGDEPATILEAAAEALRRAKSEGKDAIAFWDANEPWPDGQLHIWGKSRGFGKLPD